jgi:hypothetical protein
MAPAASPTGLEQYGSSVLSRSKSSEDRFVIEPVTSVSSSATLGGFRASRQRRSYSAGTVRP